MTCSIVFRRIQFFFDPFQNLVFMLRCCSLITKLKRIHFSEYQEEFFVYFVTIKLYENMFDIKYIALFLLMSDGMFGCRRGISRFYSGKSKSFTSLADASTSASSKDLAKPENAYNRRRRNLLAYNHVWDKNRNFPLRSNGGGISKKLAATSRSTLALAVAMSGSDGNNSSDDLNSSLNCISRSPSLLLPPLHPQGKLYHNNVSSSSPPPRNLSTWRSYSLADLQHCATTGTNNASSCSPIHRGADQSISKLT